MSRFVAPPLQPHPSTNSQNPPITPVTKNDLLPPPSHPALASRRSVSPGPDSVGALNSSPVSRSHSPAPPVPRRPSPTVPYADESDVPYSTDISSQNAPSDSLRVITSPSGYSNESNFTQNTSKPTLSVSPGVATPALLVTPAASPGSSIPAEPAPWQTEAVPPYSAQPDLPSKIDSVATEATPRPDAEGPNHNNSIQPQGPNTSRIPPPLHPSRQPSPSISFIEAPALRHRAHSSLSVGSARTPDASAPALPSQLEPPRRGSGASSLSLKDADLTDEDLQRLYDAEEVERYLRLFATRVNEVTIDPDHPDIQIPMPEEEHDWVPVSSVPTTTKPVLPPHLANPQTPFEYAASILYPYVPQSGRPPPGMSETKRKFKLTRAANAAQRLYLAMYPVYVPALVRLAHLTTWRDPQKSGLFCAIYWTAWATGFLSPLAVGRVLYLLVTGGTVTRDEIRQRREATREAEMLGKAIKGGIPGVGVQGDLGMWEITKLLASLGKKKGKKAKTVAEEVKRDNQSQVQPSPLDSEDQDAEDWRLMLVDLAEDLADLHERVKNIFIHRRPEVTQTYIILLTILFVGTLFVENTSKFITFYIGFIFWFVPPVAKLLPKLPPPFFNAPTDAEVAMELISKRVARGERVVPERIRRRKHKNKDATLTPASANASPNALASSSTMELTESSLVMSPSTTSLVEGSSSDDDAEIGFVVPPTIKTGTPGEERIRKRAIRAWNWWGRTKQMMDQARGVQGSASIQASPEQSFPAQHRSHPGMLMITSTLLTFNPLFNSNRDAPSRPVEDTRTIKVEIEHLRGVKKASPGGLIVRFAQGSTVVEERFLFVVGRDEAFAMLVGWGGGRWRHV